MLILTDESAGDCAYYLADDMRKGVWGWYAASCFMHDPMCAAAAHDNETSTTMMPTPCWLSLLS